MNQKDKVDVNLKLLKSLRETHCKSISDIASYLGYKTSTSYWLMECGRRGFSIDALYKLAKLYKYTMEGLLLVKD